MRMPISAGCIVETVRWGERKAVLPVGTIARVVSVHKPVDMRTDPPMRYLLRPLDDSLPVTRVDEDELKLFCNGKKGRRKCQRCPVRVDCWTTTNRDGEWLVVG